MDKNTKLGYCKSGADLTMQLKPQGIFSRLDHRARLNCSFAAFTAYTCILNHFTNLKDIWYYNTIQVTLTN